MKTKLIALTFILFATSSWADENPKACPFNKNGISLHSSTVIKEKNKNNNSSAESQSENGAVKKN